jgi:hypothetical protein
MLQVKDHNKFRMFEYENERPPMSGYKLGDVLLKEGQDNDRTEIGVVIQTFSDGDFRTDMWGVSSISEVSPANLSDVKKYRPNLVDDLTI